jgi:YD repeat-containing protein
MVAVVSGSGLGLFSANGASGNSNVGRGRDQVFVNTTTGNLVVQSTDDTLAALGLDFAAVRTYNSQGLTDEDNNDQWRLGVHERVYNLTGTVNTAGSTITKVFGDGAEILYTWNATRSRYESTDGDGANDFLTWSATNSTWTWTDGSWRATEEYGLVNGIQRIKFSRDADGNTVTYNYTGSLLTSLNMAGSTAQTVYFDYTDTGTAANNLRAIRVVSNGVTQTLTRYTYDASNRLQTVTLDLTPGDNSVADNVTYTTTYAYDGTSKRIASITQKDGSSVTFTYQNINGDYRLKTVTDAENRATTFSYENVTGGGGTPVSAPATTSVLSNQDTVNLPRIDAALTTNATQTTPYTRIDSALSTTDTQNVNYNRNDAALTTPAGSGGWAAPVALPSDSWSATQSSRVLGLAFDTNGNGFSLTSSVDSALTTSLKLYRYTRSTNSWSSATVVASVAGSGGVAPPHYNGQLSVDPSGNALIAWNQANTSGVFARRYTASTSTWSSTATLTSAANTSALAVASTSIVVVQSGATASVYRFNSSWSVFASLGNVSAGASAAIDNSGNMAFVYGQGTSPSAADAGGARYIASINAFGSGLLESASPTVSYPQVAIDGSGNGLAVWAQGSDVMFARFAGTGSWGTATVLDSGSGVVGAVSLALDATGNAIVGWIQNDGSVASAYAKTYSASSASWSSVVTLESSSQVAGNIRVAMRGSNAVATWTHNDGTNDNAYAATFNGTAWSTAAAIESISTGSAGAPQVAIDGNGNATAIWGWTGGSHVSYARFTPGSGGGTPYYTVPSGATWQSIANAVYGINSSAAGSALQSALGNPTLTTGAQLTGFPAQLTVTTTVTVPAYYTIPSGASWQSIANTVYGVNSAAAGSALQSALGNPTLTAGARLTGFPSTLSVTVTLAPHYLVPSGATWQSIANALFGSNANTSAGGTALQTALGNPSIASGQRLYNIPATLSVTTTVPYYYTVQSGNTWSSITQAIYGTTDAAAISALQAAVGTSTLTVGARLTVPMTLNYTTGGTGPAIYQRTTVQDALGLVTTHLKDSQGRLVSVQTPPVGGSSFETRYTYDPATGNIATIVEDPNGLNRVTTFSYDANTGLLLSTRDSLGNTVARTYNSNNQLETETSYLVRDPDGAGSGQPSSPLVARYIYDSENHLRFAISADGRVTEHIYDTPGQRVTTFKYASSLYTSTTYTESALNTWATNSARRGGALERTDYTYDFRGNVQTVTTWSTTDSAGAGVAPASTTRFIYDQRGNLLSSVEARGEATSSPTTDYLTSYTYDGLGRLLTTTSWVSSSETARLVQTNSYDDANRRTVSTFANGLTKTLNYDRAGSLISVVNGPSTLGTSTFTYDADARLRVTTDPTGVKSYAFYDDAGRQIGTVDGDGSLSELIYNRASQVVKTVRYATALSSTTLGSLAGGAWSSVAFSTLRNEANPTATQAQNQIARNVYDASGTLVYTIDPLGAVTQQIYDGAGRLTDQVRYFTAQSIAASVDEVLPAAITVASNAADRRTRYFYNGDGQLTGTLDGAGYLKENVYDAAGRLTTSIGYYTVTNSTNWLTGTLATLRPSTDARDITERYFYDAQGRTIGVLDGENYLTEKVYDVAGHVTQSIRYDSQVTYTAGTSTFSTLKSAANGAPTHATSYTYDGLGQVLTETNFEGTETLYTYDVAGNVVAVSRANGVSAEVRTARTRYDVLGRVTQELTGEGGVALAALGGSATQAQIDDVWSKYGVTYTYDNASRRTSATVRPNDSQTNTTWFYYDDDGRLRFELDARGAVKEYRYNALGQLTDEIVYWRTVSVASPTGGLLSASPGVINTLKQYETADVHEKTSYTYSLRGELLTTTTAAGATTASTYNIFGEVASRNAGSGFTAYDYTYDARGLQKLTRRGGTTFEDRTYDAFGRLGTVIDARGNTFTTTFDRLGRELTSIEPGDGAARVTTYDGFSRVKTVRDKLNNTTSYSYNDSTRTLTVTTPENIVVTTVHNRHGDTLSVTANGNTTSYSYDRDGQLIGASDSLGSLEGRSYDRAGRQITSTDARGTVTTLAYDASNRVITRTVDSASGGLQLVTTYGYDTQNRILNVTEPGGRLTRTLYDRDGRVASVIEDPNGTTPRRTDYAYDAANHTTLVTEGVGSANPRRTLYVYDALGRRTDEYVDPASLGGTLNLRTQYRFDNNGNVTRKIDAKGNSTWYVYDAQNRLTQTIDALGGVTQMTYDGADRVIATRRFFNTVSVTGFGDAPAQQSVATSVNDQVSRTVYDRDGRARYQLDMVSATGTNGASETAAVTERTFDAGGNVTRTRIYRQGLAVPATLDVATLSSALGALQTADHVAWTAYDLRGRAVYAVDGTGAVIKSQYDAAGNITTQTAFATRISLSDAMTQASLDSWSAGTSVANAAGNRVTRFWYDSLDRLRFTLNAEGFLVESRYLDSSNQREQNVFAAKPTIAAGATLADVVSAAGAASIQASRQTTTQTFDVAGRVIQITDADGKNEFLAYDAVGNKIRFVNKKASGATDANYTWTFDYDAAGRLTYERSPSLTYNSVDPATLAVTSVTGSIVTRNEYDALGNLTARTEAYGTGQARVTRYEYDALGRQTASVTPTIGIYDTAGDGQWGNGTPVAVTEVRTEIRSETSYDVFGNAFRNRLVTSAGASDPANGTYTYKVYDNLGRVLYEIDAKRQVTGNTYDVFGNKTVVTRYATPLSSAPWSSTASLVPSQISVSADSSKDRSITTTFDRLGRALSVKQLSVRNFAPTVGAAGGSTYSTQPNTEYVYNAFGDVIRTSVQINTVDFAHTYSYYDKLGQKVAELDPNRFLTQFEYDESGDLTRQVEYARATTGTVDYTTYGTIVTTTNANAAVGTVASFAGYDRETTWTYDKLNRKTTESKRNLEYAPNTTGALSPRFDGVQTTTYGYDVLGNQILTRRINPVDGSNIDTYTGYDALGRVVSVAEPARDVGTGVVRTPLTQMKRDAHGNLIQQIEYYYGAGSVPTDGRAATAATPSASLDRTTTIVVDNLGNAIRTRDATNADRYASYNVRGDAAKEWQVVFNPMTPGTTADDTTQTIVKLYKYDEVGQTTQVIESQRYSGTTGADTSPGSPITTPSARSSTSTTSARPMRRSNTSTTTRPAACGAPTAAMASSRSTCTTWRAMPRSSCAATARPTSRATTSTSMPAAR